MPTLEHIEQDILTLPREQVEELHDWLGELLHSQEGLKPEFIEAIERGKADLRAGRTRTVGEQAPRPGGYP